MNSLACSEAFVTLASQQLNEVSKFYEALLKSPPEVFVSDTYSEFSMPGIKLAIFRPNDSNITEFDNSAGAAMSLCFEVEDLDQAIALLTELGCPPPHPITEAAHGKEVYAYDPDGNRLILHQGKRN